MRFFISAVFCVLLIYIQPSSPNTISVIIRPISKGGFKIIMPEGSEGILSLKIASERREDAIFGKCTSEIRAVLKLNVPT